MHFVATVVQSSELFSFAQSEDIAFYNEIQHLMIYRGDEEHNR